MFPGPIWSPSRKKIMHNCALEPPLFISCKRACEKRPTVTDPHHGASARARSPSPWRRTQQAVSTRALKLRHCEKSFTRMNNSNTFGRVRRLVRWRGIDLNTAHSAHVSGRELTFVAAIVHKLMNLTESTWALPSDSSQRQAPPDQSRILRRKRNQKATEHARDERTLSCRAPAAFLRRGNVNFVAGRRCRTPLPCYCFSDVLIF